MEGIRAGRRRDDGSRVIIGDLAAKKLDASIFDSQLSRGRRVLGDLETFTGLATVFLLMTLAVGNLSVFSEVDFERIFVLPEVPEAVLFSLLGSVSLKLSTSGDNDRMGVELGGLLDAAIGVDAFDVGSSECSVSDAVGVARAEPIALSESTLTRRGVLSWIRRGGVRRRVGSDV